MKSGLALTVKLSFGESLKISEKRSAFGDLLKKAFGRRRGDRAQEKRGESDG